MVLRKLIAVLFLGLISGLVMGQTTVPAAVKPPSVVVVLAGAVRSGADIANSLD